MDTLKRLSHGLNKATLKSLQQRQEEELEQGAWEETLKEISQGWLWEASDAVMIHFEEMTITLFPKREKFLLGKN